MKKLLLMNFLIFMIVNQILAEEFSIRTKFIMGTYITIKLLKEKQNFFQPAFEIFKDLDNKLSIYKENSEISKLNREKSAELSKTSLEIIKKSIQISEETEGFFDITVGKLTKDVYKFEILNDKIPDDKKIKQNLKKISYKNIEIEGNKIYLKNDVKIDLGGIGKGFAVDKVSDFLLKNGVEKGVISASGDIRCLDICNIFIKNPFGEGWVVVFTTKFKNTSISTSGNYERFTISKKYNHLINPKTGKSQQNFASITLISISNNTNIDAYATAVSVMPVDLALKFLESKRNLTFVIILTTGKMIFGKNINDFVVLNGYKTIDQSKLGK